MAESLNGTAAVGCLAIQLFSGLAIQLFRREIFVVKNVRRGADQAETDLGLAGLAFGKQFAAMQDGFVRSAVRVVMQDFIDAGLGNGFARD